MVKLYLIVLLLIGVLVHYNEGAVHSEALFEDPNHPGKCVHENKVYDVGSTWPSEGKCEENSCQKPPGGDNYVLQTVGCGPTHVPGGCSIVTDLTAAYPGCCPKVECGQN